MEAEVLARISPPQRVFLTRTTVLERMSGALVEVVLDVPDAAATLAELAQSNLLLVPLDRRGKWYRYHHLFRDTLLAELERLEPGSIPVLRQRAARWCQRNELPEEALEYFMAAGDVDAVARLVEELGQSLFRQGRVTTLQRWLRWLEDRGGIERHPMAATFASLLAATVGRPAEAERWADVADRLLGRDADRPSDPYTEAMTAANRALLCRGGIEQMRADADLAARKFAEAGVVRPISGAMQGLACVLSGDLDGGDAFFEEAIATGRDVGAPDVLATILAERALIAMSRNQWDRAEDFAGQAREVLRLVGSEDALVYAVLARIAWHRSDAGAAQQALVAAQRVRPLLTYAQPHLAVQARIELARVRLALGDLAAARTLMREIDDVLKRRPGLGTLVGEAQALRARLSKERTPGAQGASSLTAAELRVLPLLATHLSFPEIGAELFLSPNTVKSQAISVYRKLGVSSRSQAVAKSRGAGPPGVSPAVRGGQPGVLRVYWRVPAAPGRGLFELARDPDEQVLPPVGGGQLYADRQAFWRGVQRKADGRLAGHVELRGVGDEADDSLPFLLRPGGGEPAQFGRGRAEGRGQQQVMVLHQPAMRRAHIPATCGSPGRPPH